MDSVHTELLRLEAAVHVIHMELQQVRRKEEQMRDVNGKNEIMKCMVVKSIFSNLFVWSFFCCRENECSRSLVQHRRIDHVRRYGGVADF